MSEVKPIPITQSGLWSIKPKKKKVVETPTSSSSANVSSSTSRKRKLQDTVFKTESSSERDKFIKVESSDDDELDPELADVFKVDGEHLLNQQESKRLEARREAKKTSRLNSKAFKDEDGEEGSRSVSTRRRRPAPALRSTLTRSEGIALQSVSDTISYVSKNFSRGVQTGIEIQNLRDTIQRLPYIPADMVFVTSKGVLSAVRSLVQDGGELGIPQDIILDAQSLYRKWLRSDFDKALMRGISSLTTLKKQEGNGKTKRAMRWGFEDNYRHKINAQVVGHNGLTVGDWWPLQICAMRDGAHGETEAGIAGGAEYGCLSVVISNGYARDEDHGDVVLYCGTLGIRTKSGNIVPSTGTKYLQKSQANAIPIRLLRAAKAKSKSIYAPSKGIRYDGLYLVEAYEILDDKNLLFRFTLRRKPGQPSIRYTGPGARPNPYDLKEWDSIQGLLRGER